MKKNIGISIILSLFTLSLSAQSAWLSTNFGFSRGYEAATINDTESYAAVNSVGADMFMWVIDYYDDFGLYVQGSTYFPQTARPGPQGTETIANYSLYDFIASFGFTAGPALRLEFTDETEVLFGFGGHLSVLTGFYEKYVSGSGTVNFSIISMNLGIGSNLSINYYLDEEIYMTMGFIFNYDFFNYFSVTLNNTTDDVVPDDYSYITLNPFIGFGLFVY